jgi:3-methyl-2-oxobutanoate hydroxymethyltransferase
MIHHCQAVKRGAPNRPLLVGDMPFGSYEYKDVDIALKNAYRMVKEGGMDAVKFEGGSEARANIVKHVVEGGGEFVNNCAGSKHSVMSCSKHMHS